MVEPMAAEAIVLKEVVEAVFVKDKYQYPLCPELGLTFEIFKDAVVDPVTDPETVADQEADYVVTVAELI